MHIDEHTIERYVQGALALHGYALNPVQAAAVTLQFARIAAIAGAMGQQPLAPAMEPLPVFRP